MRDDEERREGEEAADETPAEEAPVEGEEGEEAVEEEATRARWGSAAEDVPAGTPVFVETGRGQTAEAPLGAPFEATIDQIATDAHYGGFYRVFLNGEELLDPNEAPETIEPGQRISITSYDKVG